MAKGTKRFKRGSAVSGSSGSSGSEGLRNLDYRLSDLSGGFGGSTGSGSTAARITPTAISQPRSMLSNLTGDGPPKGYGFKLTKKFKKGGKLTDLTGDGKVTRADVLKGRGVPGFKKGGSASKRGDGCATKGKTKGRLV